MGYSLWGSKESDTTEHTLVHTHVTRDKNHLAAVDNALQSIKYMESIQ